MCKNLMYAGQAYDFRTGETFGKPKFLCSVKEYYGKDFQVKELARRAFKTNFVKVIQLNCGQCSECKLSNSAEWADRCALEMKYHNENAFITLTYDDKHLIYGKTERATILKSEIQAFNKRLRSWIKYHYPEKANQIKIKYCGEYGSDYEYVDRKGKIRKGTNRPHYHEIIFGFQFPDKEFFFYNKQGDPIYKSKILEKLWQKKGNTSTTEATWETCAYVARYIMKKQTGQNKKLYEELGICPEFTGQSTRPAIAKAYYSENKDTIYSNDGIYILKKGKAQKIKPPRYFDKLYDLENPEAMKSIKENRKEKAEGHLRAQLAQTDLNYSEYMTVKENNKEQQIKTLKRNYEAGQY